MTLPLLVIVNNKNSKLYRNLTFYDLKIANIKRGFYNKMYIELYIHICTCEESIGKMGNVKF